MVVIVLEKVTPALRGEITRWLLELKAGVFVGNVSAMVRDKLWELIQKRIRKGAATILFNAANEQGYLIKTHGDTGRVVRDFDGLQLISIPVKK